MRRRLPAIAFLSLLLASCGVNVSNGTFLFSVSGAADLEAGGTAMLDADIVPTGSFSDDVTVALAGAPAGLTADPLTLTAGTPTGKLVLHAAAGAVIDQAVVVTGTAQVQRATVELWVTVGFTTGTLDASFGSAGRATIPFDGKCSSHFMVAQPDGKLLFPVRHDAAAGQIIRLTADGQLDGSFGANGVVTLAGTAGGPSDTFADATGEILAVGLEAKMSRVWALHADGTPDDGVGTGGVVDLGAAATLDTVVLAGQKIYLAGSDTGGAWLGERLTGDGSRDAQYGTQGSLQLTFAADQAAAGHGAWLAAGATSAGNGALSLVSADGAVIASQSAGRGTFMSPLVDGGQRLVLFQTQSASGDPQAVVRRLLPDLSTDSTFGTGGSASIPDPPGTLDLAAVQSDGKIVIVRAPDFSGSAQVLRLGADGTPDPTVHVGVARLAGDPPHGSNDPVVCHGHALDAEGRLVVAYRYSTDAGVAHVVRIEL